MKRFGVALLVGLIAGSAFAQFVYTREVLVLTTPTRITRRVNTRALEIQNLGPNPIFCQLGAVDGGVFLDKSRKIDTGDAWQVGAPSQLHTYCIAKTANQLTGAATIVTEVP